MIIKDKLVLAAARAVYKFATEVATKQNKETHDVLLAAMWVCINRREVEITQQRNTRKRRSGLRPATCLKEKAPTCCEDDQDDEESDDSYIEEEPIVGEKDGDMYLEDSMGISPVKSGRKKNCKGLRINSKLKRLNNEMQHIEIKNEICGNVEQFRSLNQEEDDKLSSTSCAALQEDSSNHVLSSSRTINSSKQNNVGNETNLVKHLEKADYSNIPCDEIEKTSKANVFSIKEEISGVEDGELSSSNHTDIVPQTLSQEDIFKAADAAVAKVSSEIRDRKRGHYAYYDDETRAKIGRYAVDNGVSKTVDWFDKQFGRKVSESTVRSMRDQYSKLKQKVGAESETLPCSARGAPPKLGELDLEVQQWVSEVRRKGGVVNVRIVLAGIKGIVSKHPDYQKENITKHYARSLLRRMGFTQKRDTSENPNIPRALPPDFEVIKQEFLGRATAVISENHIPDALIINWDHISCSLIPGGDWIEQDNGSPMPSKCAMLTILLAVTKDGMLLPPQVIYAGKTHRCLPKDVSFPPNWDVTFSDSHVCSEQTMLRYIDKIILPYVNSVRNTVHGVKQDQQSLIIFDGNKTSHSWVFLQKLEENKITALYVPASCPQHLQPIDLTLCRDYKDSLKDQFHLWYTQEVVLSLAKHSEDAGISSTVDLRSSSLKPRHAGWIINTHIQMQNRNGMIRDSFKKAGF